MPPVCGRHGRGKPRKELRQWHIHRARQPIDVVERRIALAALDAADVGQMQTGSFGEGFLREPPRQPELAQTPAECPANVLHAVIVDGTRLAPLENISIICLAPGVSKLTRRVRAAAYNCGRRLPA